VFLARNRPQQAAKRRVTTEEATMKIVQFLPITILIVLAHESQAAMSPILIGLLLHAQYRQACTRPDE